MARNDVRNTVKKIRKEKRELVKVFSVSLAVALALTTFVRPTVVKGQSMEPTLEENDYLIVKSESLFGTPPKFGELIVFNSKVISKEGHRKLLKRVVGLPGDTIEVKEGKVYRNGMPLNEEYVKEDTTPGTVEKFTVEENSVFVMGDNRAHSLDSRNSALGTIAYEDIIGTVKFRLFPFNKIGKVE